MQRGLLVLVETISTVLGLVFLTVVTVCGQLLLEASLSSICLVLGSASANEKKTALPKRREIAVDRIRDMDFSGMTTTPAWDTEGSNSHQHVCPL